MSGSPGVVDSRISGGVLLPEFCLQSCDIFSLLALPNLNAICCLSSQEQTVI